jgi:hypothetical protein
MSVMDAARWWIAENRGCWCSVCHHGYWTTSLSPERGFPDDLILYHSSAGIVQPDFDVGSAMLADLTLRCTYCSSIERIQKESFVKVRKPPIKSGGKVGWHWVNDGINNKFVGPDVVDVWYERGWVRGRIQDIIPPSHSGSVRITNGVVNRIIKSHEEIHVGWWKGRSKYWKKGIEYGELVNRRKRGKVASPDLAHYPRIVPDV